MNRPDTAAGAIAALAALSSHSLKGATAQPDPSVDGVWLVSHRTGQSIVYLAGHREPMGQLRAHDDFEDVN